MPCDAAVTCRICGSAEVRGVYRAREMLQGLREAFDYFQCAHCDCLQIAEIPSDMTRYYAADYYSIRAENRVKRWLKNERLRWLSGRQTLLGRLAHRLLPRYGDLSFLPSDTPTDARVLEVGCGRGYLVEELYLRGYRAVAGIDPFMPEACIRHAPFRLERKSVEDAARNGDRFELIFLSHSLEHIADQHAALHAVARLLADGGRVVIGVPWIEGEAWRIYGTDWVGLDAPRHFYLHSRKSLELLIRDGGFERQRLYCDSYALQFWGSEQYRADIPLFAPNYRAVNPRRSVHSQAQVDAWSKRSAELNQLELGDQVVVWLRKR